MVLMNALGCSNLLPPSQLSPGHWEMHQTAQGDWHSSGDELFASKIEENRKDKFISLLQRQGCFMAGPGFTSGFQGAQSAGGMVLVVLHGKMKNRFPGAWEELSSKTFLSQPGRARRSWDGALPGASCASNASPLVTSCWVLLFKSTAFSNDEKAGWLGIWRESCSSEEKDKELLQIFMYRKSKEW